MKPSIKMSQSIVEERRNVRSKMYKPFKPVPIEQASDQVMFEEAYGDGQQGTKSRNSSNNSHKVRYANLSGIGSNP